jgi:NitT/TauT family transport system substrate-binding protein
MISRRRLVIGLAAAATASQVGPRPGPASGEPPPETTRLVVRSLATPGAGCTAPQVVAEDLLRSEGFSDVRYVAKSTTESNKALAAGEVHMSMGFVGNWLVQVDAGDPVVVLAGIHVGCFELFATDRIRTVRDLKGKTVSVTELGSGRHLFLVAALGYIGLDSRKDVNFVTHSPAESAKLLAEGTIDAYQAFAEEVQELRAKKIGRSVLSGTLDRPWSQYFCCGLAANKEFVRKHPVATKRALRAMLKASSICALEPDRAARVLVDKGQARDYEYARAMLKELPYTRWRDLHPEDSMRFYAVRLHEAGLIKTSPQKLIAQGTDWRFLNELRKELKG